METGFTLQPNARAVSTPASTQRLFKTGKVPGIAQSKRATFLFGGASNLVEAVEKILLSEFICACTSNPITLCHFDLKSQFLIENGCVCDIDDLPLVVVYFIRIISVRY